MSTAVGMLLLLGVGALAIGNPGGAVMDAFYRGLWLLLPFTMQMALILVLSSTLSAAPAQQGLLALSIGDQMGNLLTPFWAAVGAGVARIDFRRFIGYQFAYAAIWFVLGVLMFTFLPL